MTTPFLKGDAFARNSLRFRNAALQSFNRCQWCNCPLNRRTATADHIVPVSRGGTDGWDNLCLSCGPCNSRKDNREAGRPRFGPADWSEVFPGSAAVAADGTLFPPAGPYTPPRPTRLRRRGSARKYSVWMDGKRVCTAAHNIAQGEAALLRKHNPGALIEMKEDAP